MEGFTLIAIAVVVVVLLSFKKVISFLVKFTFYALLVVLVMILFFDVNLNQIFDWVLNVALWAF